MGKLLTQKEFIKRASERHGNKYDFSKAVYIHSKQKLTVFCNKHKKDFFLSPNHILKGIGCPDCGGTKKLTIEEFIDEARKAHGNRYNYSKVIYKNYETKVELVCSIHDSFFQRPHSHLDGGGCPSCGGSKPLDTNEFIKRAIAIHGNEYDYSQVIYTNTKSEVEIICKKHGVFFQSAGGHLNGYKCKKCSGNHTPTTSEFIDKANLIHKGYYTYDKVEYKNAHSLVTITCKIHGDFQQAPNSHLKGSECSLCSLLKKKYPKNIPNSKSLTEEYVRQAKIKYGNNKYDYSKVLYVNNKTKIIIGCKIHGQIQQYPNVHINGLGCPHCAVIEVGDKRKKSYSFFIKKAREIHGKKYEYPMFNFYKSRTSIIINCKKHGEYEQVAYAHLRGQSCPKCKESFGERRIRVFLEKHQIKYTFQKKFNDCKNTSYLFFDFYVPNQNLLIEYDGEQHFGTTRGDTFGGKVGFEKRKINDGIKNSYAKTKNIKLLRINFKQLNNIEKILTQQLYDNEKAEKHYR